MGTIQKGLFVKKVFFTFSIILGLLLSTNVVRASHIMGSDIFWDCMGSDTFKITIRVYRDCKGVELLSTPFTLTSDTVMKSLSSSRTYLGDVTPVCDKLGCTGCSSSTCPYKFGVEAFDLTSIVYLGDWRKSGFCNVLIEWQQCCRNKAITTGASDQNFYTSAQMNICLSSCDNSPRWSYSPFAIMCLGSNFQWIPGLMELDMDTSSKSVLDSFAFSIDTPMLSATQKTKWNGGFSPTRPLQYSKSHFDSLSGDLSFRPMREQISIMTIRVDQYRNGVNIGHVRRELQFIVVKCSSVSQPLISTLNLSGKTSNRVTSVNRCLGDLQELTFRTNDVKNDTVKLEILSMPPGASFWLKDSTARLPVGVLHWKIDTQDFLNSPRIIRLKASDNSCSFPLHSIKTYKIYINSRDTFATQFYHSVLDSTCGKLALWGGSLDTIVNDNQYWYVNDTLIGTGDSVTHNITSLDTQNVKVFIDRGGCLSEFNQEIIPPKFKPIYLETLKDTVLCENSVYEKRVSAKGGDGRFKYSWSVGDFPFSNTKDSFIVFSVLEKKYKESGKLLLVVEDGKGCKRKQEFNYSKLVSKAIDLFPDTLVCSSDTFSINLPLYQGIIGKWWGWGVRNRKFQSSLLKEGGSNNYFSGSLNDGTCVHDISRIEFEYDFVVTVDSFVETCLFHERIPLKAGPIGGQWIGEGIVDDVFFQKNSHSPKTIELIYQYNGKVGCKDSGVTIVRVGAVSPEINARPDTIFCDSDSLLEVKVDALSGKWVYGDKIVDTLNGKWSVNESNLSLGMNFAVFEGLDLNYCKDSDTLFVNYVNSPIVSFSVSGYEVCVGADSVELQVTPHYAQVYGDSLVKIQGSHYVVPTEGMIGRHEYSGKVVDSSGCVGEAITTILVKDTVIRTYNFDTSICVKELVKLPSVPDSGYWYGPNRLVFENDGNWWIRPNKVHAGSNEIFYRTYLEDRCYHYDTSIVIVDTLLYDGSSGGDTVCLEKDSVSYLFDVSSGFRASGYGISNGAKNKAVFHESDEHKVYKYILEKIGNHGCPADTFLLSLGRKMEPKFSVDRTMGVKPLKINFKDETPGVVFNKWTFGTGDSAINNAAPAYTYQTQGRYDVRLIAYDKMRFCGSSVLKREYIHVSENNSISEVQNGISVFPNPVNDFLTVNTAIEMEHVPYRIYNSNGALVVDGVVRLESGSGIEVSRLSSGSYWLELTVNPDDIRTVAFTKE